MKFRVNSAPLRVESKKTNTESLKNDAPAQITTTTNDAIQLNDLNPYASNTAYHFADYLDHTTVESLTDELQYGYNLTSDELKLVSAIKHFREKSACYRKRKNLALNRAHSIKRDMDK